MTERVYTVGLTDRVTEDEERKAALILAEMAIRRDATEEELATVLEALGLKQPQPSRYGKLVTRDATSWRGSVASDVENSKLREKCVNNHPVSPDNVYVSPLGRRECKECRRMQKRNSRARAK